MPPLTESLYSLVGPMTVLASLALLACAVRAEAGENVYYVSPAGNDAWSGRLADPNARRTDGPWKTISKACAAARPGDTCRLRGGIYREVLKPARDGTPGAPIVFEAQAGEEAVLSGADPLVGWEAAGEGLFKAPMAGIADFKIFLALSTFL